MSNIYKLRIEQPGSDPMISRTITVSDDTLFDQLHAIIGIIMGFPEDMPYEFNVGNSRLCNFNSKMFHVDDPDPRDATDTSLDELFTMAGITCTYMVDENLEFKIRVEKILNAEDNSNHPVCHDGVGMIAPLNTTFHSETTDLPGNEHHSKYMQLDLAGLRRSDMTFEIEEVNEKLRQYHDEYLGTSGDDNVIPETYEDMKDYEEEYESVRKFRLPIDLLTDPTRKQQIQDWLSKAFGDENGLEKKTLDRLTDRGYGADECNSMIQEAFAIEMFYELKYGTYIVEDRYKKNLSALPEKPEEITSLQCACEVLDMSLKGIPFNAIEYLHNDTSAEARQAIVNALHKAVGDSALFYACAAEGHICEELIDPVIGFYEPENMYQSDWFHSQGQFLIGKLAQSHPDATVEKVLATMEQEAKDFRGRAVYYLFDVFDFCDISKYKERLIALLKQQETSFHDALAVTMAHLKISESLPILKEQVARLKLAKPELSVKPQGALVELQEAIQELESGTSMYPDQDIPLCVSRKTTWREEFADGEEYFYHDDFSADHFDDEEGSLYLENFNWAPQQPIVREIKVGRNDPCHCGSGKKYKKCCLDSDLRKGMT